MRGVYTARHQISALSAAKTLMYLTAPADRVIEILGAWVTNVSNATNQQLEVSLQRITTIGTPTATTITPTKGEKNDQAAAATCKANVTASEPTYDANAEIDKRGFPSLNGYAFEPTPEERPTIAGQESVGLRMLSTPTAFDADIMIRWREIG